MLRTKAPSGTYPDLDISIAGIPCTVTAWINGPDPSVGLNNSWVQDYEITHIAGRKIKAERHAHWLYDKYTTSYDVSNKVNEAIFTAISDRNDQA